MLVSGGVDGMGPLSRLFLLVSTCRSFHQAQYTHFISVPLAHDDKFRQLVDEFREAFGQVTGGWKMIRAQI